MSFDDWLIELDAEAERIANVKNLVRKSGRECWQYFFDNDYSPADALAAQDAKG